MVQNKMKYLHSWVVLVSVSFWNDVTFLFLAKLECVKPVSCTFSHLLLRWLGLIFVGQSFNPGISVGICDQRTIIWVLQMPYWGTVSQHPWGSIFHEVLHRKLFSSLSFFRVMARPSVMGMYIYMCGRGASQDNDPSLCFELINELLWKLSLL